MTECAFSLGKQPYTYNFLVCKDLSRPMILGLDFPRINRIGTDWSQTREICITPEGYSSSGILGDLYYRTKDLY